MKKLIVLGFAAALSACGSTSNLQNTENKDLAVDLTAYETVIVNNFTDGVSDSKQNVQVIAEGRKFADILAGEIEEKGSFSRVFRNLQTTENALIIDGEVTKLEDGNAAARLLIGFGAGSSEFDAKVTLKDNKTKKVLGSFNVGEFSWALGGTIAATQDVDHHMRSAAAKISQEVEKSHTGMTG